MKPKNVESIYRLSPTQEGILFHTLYEPGSGLYVLQLGFRLRGELDVPALRRAWETVVGRHAVLRSAFHWEGLEKPVQVVHNRVPLPWREEDWSALPAAGRDERWRELCRADLECGFDLATAPLLRLTLAHEGDGLHRFLWSFHHILVDGWCLPILFQEVFTAYAAHAAGREPSLEAVRPYRDFIAWLLKQDQDAAEPFWRQILAGFRAPTPLGMEPPRHPDPSGPEHAEVRDTLPAALSADLAALAQRHRLTLSTLVQGAWALLLARGSGEDDVVFGVTVSGRSAPVPGIGAMVGLFINTLPARVRVPAETPLLPWLREIQERHSEVLQHEAVPLVRIQGWSEVPRGTALFESLLVFENYPVDSAALTGAGAALALDIEVERAFNRVNYPLSLAVLTGERLVLLLKHKTRWVEATAAARCAGQVRALLEGMMADPQAPLGDISLLAAAERHQVLVEWNDTRTTALDLRCFPEVFGAQARRDPAAPALVAGDARLSYRELDERANRLAHRLLALGAGRGRPVALYLERSADFVVGLLAAHKAGAAYLPLDPAFPVERVESILADAEPVALVTRSSLAAELVHGRVEVLDLDQERDRLQAQPAERPAVVIEPEDLAYVIYTSGSTGRPKGVAVEHRHLASYIRGVLERLWPLAGETWAVVSTLAADLGHTCLFPALATGGCLHVVAPEDAMDPAAFADYCRLHPIDILKIVPSHLAALEAAQGAAALPRRRLVLGGEAFDLRLAERLRATVPPGCVILNHYGPTETTVGVTTCSLQSDIPWCGTTVPLGRPLADTCAYVVDSALHPLPIGAPGELLLGGDHVARGYFARPDLTAERFVPDLFWSQGGRLYRTGDRVRLLPNGQLEFLGRIDRQVKIRGFRIEPGEVEAVLRRHPGLREVVVLAQVAADTGEVHLAACAVPQDIEAPPAFRELRDLVRRALPEAAVPASFVLLETIPLTPNGKVDRRALADLELRDAVKAFRESVFAAPRTPAEELIAGFICEVLGLAQVAVDADFFELGGHSLLATRLLSRMRATLWPDLELRSIFERRTAAGLAALVAEGRRRDPWTAVPPLVRQGRGATAPLSFAQERLWFINQLDGRSAVYNVPRAIALQGPLRPAALDAALDEIVRRHEVLRTVFTVADREPFQMVQAFQPLGLSTVDLCTLPEALRGAEADRLAGKEARRLFDLKTGPLLRATLLRLGSEEHRLLLNSHHIVSDAWSAGVLLREVAALYEAFSAGRPSPLPELPLQYADFALWQRSWLSGEVLAGLLAAWRERLAGVPPALELPADRPRPAFQSSRGACFPVRLDAASVAALHDLSRRRGATLFMTLLAAFQVLLHRLSGQDDLVVGSPVAGRNRQEIEGLIGVFINMLALRTDLADHPSFDRLLARVRETALEAYALQDLPFEKLVEELQPVRDLARAPLFQAVFVLQNAPLGPFALPGLTLTPLVIETGTAKLDLTLSLAPWEDGLTGALEIDRDLFDTTTAERLIRSFRRLAAAAAGRPDLPIGELPFLSDEEAHQLVVEWNDTRVARESRCVHEMFTERARIAPDALAVTGSGGSLTYGELEAASNRLARRLRRVGVGPEVLVIVCLERSPALPTALLGILKAGGAYIPVDPSYPVERLLSIVRDTGATVVLTESRHRDLFAPGGLDAICLDVLPGGLHRESAMSLPASVGPENLAYVIYTSGSTGRPKGVMISHRAIANRLVWMQEEFPLDPGDAVLQKTPFSFDASIWEIFLPLMTGARLVMAEPGGHRDVGYLRDVIRQQEVTVLQLVPSMLSVFLEQEGLHDHCRSLRRVFCGGEAFPRELAERFWERLPGVGLCNLYGPTEAAIDASFQECGPEPAGILIPIGRPLRNVQIYLLDRQGHLAAPGVVGELGIGGVGLGRGYLGQAEKTAERFVPNAWSRSPGARLYRTGDLARRSPGRPDGAIEFLGRVDCQVKVRGFRIEPGEIEAALRQHPAVCEAVVVARDNKPGERRLVGYVVLESQAIEAGNAVTMEELRDLLSARLPDYMVPSVLMPLRQLPRLPNGKLDRTSLPAPDWSRRGATSTPPRNAVEELVAGAFADLLGLARVGVGDDFFALGGHSLLATRLVARVRSLFGTELSLREIFEHPTVAGLAAKIQEIGSGSPGAGLPPLVPVPREGDLPLSFAQQRLWFLDQLGPGGAVYNVPTALRLHGALNMEGLALSLDGIGGRHEALRTSFPAVQGQPVQRILPAEPMPLSVVDLACLPAGLREAELALRIAAEATRPFDLARGPLFRTALLRLAEDDHVLVLVAHHIIADAWSTGIFVRELSAFYAGLAHGERPSLPLLPVQPADHAVWQRSWLQGEALEAELASWREMLGDAPPVLELPTDRPRPAVQTFRGERIAGQLSPERLASLQTLSRRSGGTLFMTLLAGFGVLLGRLSGQETVVVGSPIANRSRAELEGVIGLFTNTLALRVDLGGDPPFGELLSRVRNVALAAYAHQNLPFETLVDGLAPERSLSRTPLFQVMLVLHNARQEALDLPGLRLERMEADSGTSKFDLTLTLAETPNSLASGWELNRDLFDRATVLRLAGYFARLLAGLSLDPDARIGSLPLLGEAEQTQVLREWNDTAAVLSGRRLVRRFEEQVRRSPQEPAVVFEEEVLTYRELDIRANRLARFLGRLGVGLDVKVGLCVERSLALATSVLGVLKAGGACLPLDPSYPRERLGFMLSDTAAPVVLTEARLAERLADVLGGGGARMVLLDADWPEIVLEAAEAPAVEILPEHLFYVIYTSGSTGHPKGIELPHQALENLLEWHLESLRRGARTLGYASLSFDASYHEMFAAWTTGGTLYVVPEELRRDVSGLAGYLERHRIEKAILPVVVLHGLAEEHAAGRTLPDSLREVVTTGEQLQVTAAVADLFDHLDLPLDNHYGPSESHVVSSYRLAGSARSWPYQPPIGRPIANSRLHVVDREFRPVPVGVAGELLIGGVCLARGYLDRPDLTAERFVPDPLGEAGERLYRTGDLARHLPGGEIEFLGRIDQQVKIRGFRVEPGEVEAVLVEHPAIREAVVVARPGPSGDLRLVAYVVSDLAEPSPAELRRFVEERLPGFMVPSQLVRLAALPLSPNRKVDRQALPAPDWAGTGAGAALQTPVEELLATIFAELLRVERVGAGDSFFEFGGHSLLAMRAVSRVRIAFGVELPLRALFESPTVEGFARTIEAALRSAATPAPPIVPVPRAGELPLSFAQERLWFLEELAPGTATYHIPLFLRLSGRLDPQNLEESLREVVQRHEALRTVFLRHDGRPLQAVTSWSGPQLSCIDLSGLAEPLRGDVAARLAREEGERPFDLERGPLLRAVLLRLGREKHDLLLTLHHIVADGWSLGILGREVSTLYAARAAGCLSPLPQLPVQYADYAFWQRGWLVGEALDAELAGWRNRMAGAPAALDLPTDRLRPPLQSFRGAAEPFTLPEELACGLRALARSEGVTLFMILFAGFASLLHRTSGQDDVVIGAPLANRSRQEVEQLIGLFLNTLPLRARLHREPTFRELLGRVRETTLEAYSHQEVPFEKLVEALAPSRDLSRSPIFQVMLVLQERSGELRLPGLEAAPLRPQGGTARLDLLLGFVETDSGIAGAAEWSTDLFETPTVRRLLGHFRNLLAAGIADPAGMVAELPLLSEAERRQILTEWNATEAPFPRGLGLHDLFATQAACTPEATALIWGHERMSYRELQARAGRLACKLRRLGVGPEVLVGVCSDRAPAMIIALLAVLEAGGACLPLDPTYPQARLAFLIADAGAPVLLVQDHLLSRLPHFSGEVVRLEGSETPVDTTTTESARSTCSPEQLAYLIYTSGSTGTPKGVAIRHVSAVALIEWAAQAYTAEELAGVLAATSVCFDLSVFEIFVPLSVGGSVILADDALALAGLPAAGEVTLINTVPSAMAELVRAGAVPASVRTVNLAGEPLPRELADRLYELPCLHKVYNLYGPSEDTTYSTGAWVPRVSDGPLTIGRPLANARVYLLDARLQPVGVRVCGEVWIGGEGLARGYLERPDLTADRFRPDSFSGLPGQRLYGTGDLARYRPDGEIELLGRLDHQVKIRGFRIELGEIEAALARHPAVRESVVVAKPSEGVGPQLVAYLVQPAGDAAQLGEAEIAEALRAHLRESLPGFMMPAAFVVLDRLPLTPNGKVDRRALPAPSGRDVRTLEEFRAPESRIEKVVAEVWRELLGLEAVGSRDNLFDLGGHSLLAVRIAARLRAQLRVEVSLQDLFLAPTVERLAEKLERALPVSPLLESRPRIGRDQAAVSFEQHRLWLQCSLDPASVSYNLPVALRLEGDLQRAALERALDEIVRRHETLRTTFRFVGEALVQAISRAVPQRGPLVDLGALPATHRTTVARHLISDEVRRPFDLQGGPLFRVLLVRLHDREHLLAMTIHHIVSDAWSLSILVREAGTLYQAFSQGRPSPLPELPAQYADYASWQRTVLVGEALNAQIGYWRERLSGAPMLELPTDHPRRPQQSLHGGRQTVELSSELSEGVREVARVREATPFVVLLAAFNVFLLHRTGQEDIVVGLPVAGRSRADHENLIGYFINALALRTDLRGNPSFGGLVARLRANLIADYAHQSLPFETLVEVLRPHRRANNQPFFQVVFNHYVDPLPAFELSDLNVTGVGFDNETTKYDMTMYVRETGGRYRLVLAYDAALFEPETAASMLRKLTLLLHWITERPEALVKDLCEDLRQEERQSRLGQEMSLREARRERLKNFRQRAVRTLS